MMALNWLLSTSNGQPLHSSPSRFLSSLQNFLNHHCHVGSPAVHGPNALLMLWVVSAALQPILNLNRKIIQICFLSNIISIVSVQFSSVAQLCPTVLQPHGLQHTRPPCPSPTPGVYPSSCPLSGWYHPTISSCVIPFSSCPQSFPASGSFQMSQLFASGGGKYWSFSFNISPSNEYSGLLSFRVDWLDLLAVQGTSKSLL